MALALCADGAPTCGLLEQVLSRPHIDTWRLMDLLAHGCCDLSTPYSSGMTPVQVATLNGGTAHVEALVQAGARVVGADVALAESACPGKAAVLCFLRKAALHAKLEQGLVPKGNKVLCVKI